MLRIVIPLIIFFSFVFSSERVTLSIYPLYLLAKEIAGDRLVLSVLLPAKADYHFYELSPKDIRKLSESSLIILSSPIEPWSGKIASLFGERVKILLKKRETVEGDMHFWLSPRRSLVVAERLYKVLSSSGSSKLHSHRFQRLKAKLSHIDREFSSLNSTCRLRTIISTHSAFKYLSEDYGIKEIAPREGHAHGDLSAGFLKEAMMLIRAKGIKYVIAPSGESSKLEEILKSEGLEIIHLDLKLSSYESYIRAIEDILKALRKALECE